MSIRTNIIPVDLQKSNSASAWLVISNI